MFRYVNTLTQRDLATGINWQQTMTIAHLGSDLVNPDTRDFEAEAFLLFDHDGVGESLPLKMCHSEVGADHLLHEVLADVEFFGRQLLFDGEPRLDRGLDVLVLELLTSVGKSPANISESAGV